MIRLLLVTSLVASAQTLPSSYLTPGAVSDLVSQTNIHDTICQPSYTIRVRPLTAYTDALKLKQIGYLGLPGRAANYEEDHLIPLELGGAPYDTRNLWPQQWVEARRKDRLENALHKLVCAEKLPLQVAQTEIAVDWWSSFQVRILRHELKGN